MYHNAFLAKRTSTLKPGHVLGYDVQDASIYRAGRRRFHFYIWNGADHSQDHKWIVLRYL